MVARQFLLDLVNRRMPILCLLETDDHSITLLFESRLTIGERKLAILRFPFTWPASLVDPDTRACRGRIKMTLVYEPPLDPAFGHGIPCAGLTLIGTGAV